MLSKIKTQENQKSVWHSGQRMQENILFKSAFSFLKNRIMRIEGSSKERGSQATLEKTNKTGTGEGFHSNQE